MKNLKTNVLKRRSLLAIALVAVIGFTFAACGDDDDGGKDPNDNPGGPQKATYVSTDNDGNKYTLEINESGKRSARSAAQAGDTFKLTVDYTTAFGGGSLNMKFEYSGTVGAANASGQSVSLTLNINGETITITIVGTQMTVITGKIVNDSGEEVVNDPGAVTPVNFSLNGTWQSTGTNVHVVTISGSSGVFDQISSVWQSAINAGNIRVGDEKFRNITKTGDRTWSCEERMQSGSSVFWENANITIEADGQSFRTSESPGGTGTWTRVSGGGTAHSYEVVNQSLSWTDAKAEAERRGGYLAVITSAEEQEMIESIIARDGTKRGYFIGGYCESDRIWKWVTGEPVSYTNWGPSEPSGGTQNRMVILRQPLNNILPGQWDDDRDTANTNNGYIIEWDNGGNPNPGTVAVTGVALNKTQLSLTVDAQETLTATVAPSNAANKNVTWSSSDSSIAEVSYGTVSGVSAGTATITVTTADGNKQASCTVTVSGGAGGVPTFTTIPEFSTWLGSQPVNTVTTAYSVNINVSNLGGGSGVSGSLGNMLRNNANANKYVTIDLSGSTITAIPTKAFEHCYTLAGVTIGGSVTSIGEEAFWACNSLASVTIGGSVTSIGKAAFNACTSLASVTIGGGVTSIGENAFRGCTNLPSVTIPNSVTSIGNAAFYECSSLAGVTIPNNVTSIGNYAFGNCTVLTSVTFTATSKVASIGEYAFDGCTLLTGVIIPNSVTGIGYRAFRSCTNLASVTIGSGVTTIAQQAFSGCTNLTSVTFLGTIESTTTAWPTSNTPFEGDLRAKYFAVTGGGPGTYTRAGTVWTRQ